MVVHFWGTRGSLPAPLDYRSIRLKLREALSAARGRDLCTPQAIDSFIDQELPFWVRGSFGGNSSCVELITGAPQYFVCDLGSGVREFGNSLLARHGARAPHHFDVFMSHLHWDHIMGFPFFAPAFIPGNVIRIHGCHKSMRDIFIRQQSAPCFPVDFRSLAATIEFVILEPDRTYEIDGCTVRPFLQNHANDSYGYRFVRDGKTIVYSTDCEHKFEILKEDYRFIEYFRDADVLIFDAMYSLGDQISVKEDWGHSSNIVAVELAQMAGVKHLVMFHHEPIYDDRMIDTILHETRRYEEIIRLGPRLTISSAYDGLEIEA